jgi:cullin 1
MSDQE